MVIKYGIQFQGNTHTYIVEDQKYIDLGRSIDWRRKWHPTPVLLPGKSHRQRSLVGYSPWGR